MGVWFFKSDQKMTKYYMYEHSVNQTNVNLPVGLGHCNHWKKLATVPLQTLPFLSDTKVYPVLQALWAVEIKRGLAPRLEKGFHHAREDLEPERSFVVYSGNDRYTKGEGVEMIGLGEFALLLANS